MTIAVRPKAKSKVKRYFDHPVIDGDGHVMETLPEAVNWEEAIEPAYRHLAPKYIPFETGGGRIFVEGKIFHTPRQGGDRMYKQKADSATVHAERPGMWRPEVRLPDMDKEGIDVAVLFGSSLSVAASSLRNKGLSAAISRAYNNWLHKYCSYAPGRLKGIAAIPYNNLEEGPAEMERAVKLGAFAGFGMIPNLWGKNPDHKDFWPFYAQAEKLNTPMCLHLVGTVPGMESTGKYRFDDFMRGHALMHPMEQMLGCATVACGGVMDAYPKLRYAFLEGNAGWIPFWFERMDEQYEKLGQQVDCKAKPSEYLMSGQLFFSCELEEKTLPYVFDLIGDDKVIYASDYWHWDAAFPNSVKIIADRKDLTPQQKRKLMLENAARLYNIKL